MSACCADCGVNTDVTRRRDCWVVRAAAGTPSGCHTRPMAASVETTSRAPLPLHGTNAGRSKGLPTCARFDCEGNSLKFRRRPQIAPSSAAFRCRLSSPPRQWGSGASLCRFLSGALTCLVPRGSTNGRSHYISQQWQRGRFSFRVVARNQAALLCL